MKLNQKEIKKLLQKEDPLILEIGAHKGFDTKQFLKEFKTIKLYCFEPDPRCINAFKASIKDKRCTLIEAAISNKNGETILNMSGGYFSGRLYRFYNLLKTLHLEKYFINQTEEWNFSSSIKRSISNSKDFPWLVFNKTIEVNTYKLDTWVEQNNINYIDFIWSDIQGAERDLIEGVTNTLKKVKYLYTEYGAVSTYPDAMTKTETIELLSKHNFKLIDKYSSNSRSGDLLFVNNSLL